MKKKKKIYFDAVDKKGERNIEKCTGLLKLLRKHGEVITAHSSSESNKNDISSLIEKTDAVVIHSYSHHRLLISCEKEIAENSDLPILYLHRIEKGDVSTKRTNGITYSHYQTLHQAERAIYGFFLSLHNIKTRGKKRKSPYINKTIDHIYD